MGMLVSGGECGKVGCSWSNYLYLAGHLSLLTTNISLMAVLDWNTILVGVFSSLIASLLWVVILFRVRPHISISPEIAIDKDPNNGSDVYVFKVINNSPFFKIYELKCAVTVLEIVPSHNGENTKRTEDVVELINDQYWVLGRFNLRHISQWFKADRKLKTQTDYAAQFGTRFNLKGAIKNVHSRKVRVEVFCKHPLSGFSKVKYEDYRHESEFVQGSFCSGNCFKIKA